MDWTEIALNITKGRTVLVLGPDAIPLYPVSGKMPEGMPLDPSFSVVSRYRINETLKKEVSYYYHRDDLFLFANSQAKRRAMEIVEETITDGKWAPDSELLRKIVAIPFPLILNFNSDKYVYDAFLKYGSEPQFDYFTAKHKNGTYEISKEPDCYDHPILYNLCGSVLDALDSVILDHYDLFGLLKALLNDKGVSEKLINKLKDADRFILLGFELERWYFQVFLHYLNRLDNNAFDNYRQNFPILSNVSEDSREFVMKQFNIEHFASSRDDFDQLHAACAAAGILRKIQDPASPVLEQLRLQVANGNMEEAFRLFEQHGIAGEERDVQLPLLQSRYSDWKKQQRLDTQEDAAQRKELNSIRYALLTLANETLT